MQNVVRALWTAHVSPTEFMSEGDLYLDTHPMVIEHPDWFSADLAPIARGYDGPVIEEATAEPGARRTTTTKAR